ncbi:hypothetical protein SDC9_126372 [bioreactor metagenome]|uniref:Uncharacterized protein n=1 Tax=bioreactor metagenome TaxID=1076179 RepID=A0A645CR24_9ZZZZ
MPQLFIKPQLINTFIHVACPNIPGVIVFDLVDQVEEIINLVAVYPLAIGVSEIDLKGCIG